MSIRNQILTAAVNVVLVLLQHFLMSDHGSAPSCTGTPRGAGDPRAPASPHAPLLHGLLGAGLELLNAGPAAAPDAGPPVAPGLRTGAPVLVPVHEGPHLNSSALPGNHGLRVNKNTVPVFSLASSAQSLHLPTAGCDIGVDDAVELLENGLRVRCWRSVTCPGTTE